MGLRLNCLCRRCLQRMLCTMWMTQPSICRLRKPHTESPNCGPDRLVRIGTRDIQSSQLRRRCQKGMTCTVLLGQSLSQRHLPGRYRMLLLLAEKSTRHCTECTRWQSLSQGRRCLLHMPCTMWMMVLRTSQMRTQHIQSTGQRPCRRCLQRMLCMTQQLQQNTLLHCMQHRLSPGPSPSRPRRLGSPCRWWQHLLSTGLLRSSHTQLMGVRQCRRCLLHMPCTMWLTALSKCQLRKAHI